MFDLELCTQALEVTRNGLLRVPSFLYNLIGVTDLDFLKSQNNIHPSPILAAVSPINAFQKQPKLTTEMNKTQQNKEF